ncbi:protease complex subunit PrcB family protein [Methylobacter sp. S3L5C]|uniref:protease complex subunit PrcB family protein n=1 Tax=Methylobacter sp. S3L5C TaxID=2839024 RepID=UPI001FAE388A|nr:protease complex subunit PrcB family protein [Methylobacter sp. S3L5C]UOA08957.1 protease complex subunit PrcB family protein [Methylobacter sp. S3L5C]
MMKLYWIPALLAAIICATNTVLAQGNQIPQSETFTVLAQGSDSHIEQQHFQILRDNTDLQKLWDSHLEGVSPKPSAPDVNFSNETIIAAFAGTKNTGGYVLNITGINVYPDRVQIDLSLIKPGDNCMVSTVLTQPFVLVKTAQLTDKPVNFNLQLKAKNCETGNIQ